MRSALLQLDIGSIFCSVDGFALIRKPPTGSEPACWGNFTEPGVGFDGDENSGRRGGITAGCISKRGTTGTSIFGALKKLLSMSRAVGCPVSWFLGRLSPAAAANDSAMLFGIFIPPKVVIVWQPSVSEWSALTGTFQKLM